MNELERLAAAARPEPGDPEWEIATFRIDGDARADRAIGGLVEYFGADRSRAEVLLVIDDTEVGYLARADLYASARVAERGLGSGSLPGSPFGGAGRAIVPGTPTGGGGILVLRCPVPACPESPVFAISFDEDHPPHCRAHADTALLWDGA